MIGNVTALEAPGCSRRRFWRRVQEIWEVVGFGRLWVDKEEGVMSHPPLGPCKRPNYGPTVVLGGGG